MAAGLSRERQLRIERREIRKIRRELEAAGVSVAFVYRNPRQLVHFEKDGGPSGGFIIVFRRMNASNGECALYPEITIGHTLKPEIDGEYRGWWDERTYNKGLANLIGYFGTARNAEQTKGGE